MMPISKVASRRLLSSDSLATFLAPSVFRPCLTAQQLSAFSSSAQRSLNLRDRNRSRGVSPLRRTGPKHELSVSKEPLPRPVLDPTKRSKVPVKDDHPLWQFFTEDKKPLVLPEDEAAHGRAWAVEELRHKSFDDLHSLWWVCVKERNRIKTQEHERQSVNAGYGEYEASERELTVRRTQRAIKHALTERWYAWQEARKLYDERDDFVDDVDEEEEGEPEVTPAGDASTSEAAKEALLPDYTPRDASTQKQSPPPSTI